jgi:flagellar FliL protein
MADETPPPADAVPPAAPKAKRSYVTAVVIVAGLLGGGGFGAFVGGPLLASRVARPVSAARPGEHDGAPAVADRPAVVIIDNMVLNPAESGGLRFLLVTVGLRLAAGTTAEKLTARDAEIRDVIMHALGTRRVDELANISLRDQLKKDVLTAVNNLMGASAVSGVYFPQFVIQ